MADSAALYARLAKSPRELGRLYHDIGFEPGHDVEVHSLLTKFATGVTRFKPEQWSRKLVERLVEVYADLSGLLRRYLPPPLAHTEAQEKKSARLKAAKELLGAFSTSSLFLNDFHCSVLDEHRDQVGKYFGLIFMIRDACFGSSPLEAGTALVAEYFRLVFWLTDTTSGMVYLAITPYEDLSAALGTIKGICARLKAAENTAEKISCLRDVKHNHEYTRPLNKLSSKALNALYLHERPRFPVWTAVQRVQQACERYGGNGSDYEQVLHAAREFRVWVAGFRYSDWTMEYQDQVAAYIEAHCIPKISNKTIQQQLKSLLAMRSDVELKNLLELGHEHYDPEKVGPSRVEFEKIKKMLFGLLDRETSRSFRGWLQHQAAIESAWTSDDRNAVARALVGLYHKINAQKAEARELLRRAMEPGPLLEALTMANGRFGHDASMQTPREEYRKKGYTAQSLGRVALSPRQTFVYQQTHAGQR